MPLLEGEFYILNENARKGLPHRVGERCVIVSTYYSSPNYQFIVEFDDLDTAPVKESELTELTAEDKDIMNWLYADKKVTHIPTGEYVKVKKVDYLNKQVEIDFKDNSTLVEDFRNLREIAVDDYTLPVLEFENTKLEDSLVKTSSLHHEQLINVFFKHYENEDGTYTVPKELLNNLLEHIFE